MINMFGRLDGLIGLDAGSLRLHREMRHRIARIPDEAGVAADRADVMDEARHLVAFHPVDRRRIGVRHQRPWNSQYVALGPNHLGSGRWDRLAEPTLPLNSVRHPSRQAGSDSVLRFVNLTRSANGLRRVE